MRLPAALVRAVARGKPLVPDSAWPLLLTLRSLQGERPVIGLPAFRRVVVLAPHPDDESVGCGGTIALLAAAGALVTVVFATDGDATIGSGSGAGETAVLRRGEAERALQVLGVTGVTARFLGLPDGGLAGVLDQLTEAVSSVVAEAGPEAVLLPWFFDAHDDHRALSRALVAGRDRLPADLEVWAFETWTPLPPNRLVDITGVVERKQAAIAAHVTAHQAFDVGALLGLSRYRSVHGLMGRGYAEAFLAAPLAQYVDLVQRAAPPSHA